MILSHRAFCLAAMVHSYHADVSGQPISRLTALWQQLPAVCAAEVERWQEYEVKRGDSLRRRDPIYSIRIAKKDRQPPKAIR
jgi:hypothetical protein